MSGLYAQRNEFEVERTGIRVNVPNNDVARLMYYLNCVCIVIDCNNEPSIQRYTTYQNWYSLSLDEQKVLLALCYTFNPDILQNKVFFQYDALCQDGSNEFYEIRQARSQFLIHESILIAGRQHHINNIMAYKTQWMSRNYYEPRQRLVARLNNSNTPAVMKSSYVGVSSSRSKTCKYIWCGIVCFFCIIPGIIGIIVAIVNAVKK
ncbi:unnamed protein product [Rotaria sp. Silwood1]|nr:unnamed protein product [Rotaria sp. Silwood1]CAF3670836.1 unnamed protein product [Rotaria sp. Silwood1]CAF3738474.1 unnamed protein product [Rotaria sp. Silwood1]